MTIRFSNPSIPLIFARQTSAIPPEASSESISYVLNRAPASHARGCGRSTSVSGVGVAGPRGGAGGERFMLSERGRMARSSSRPQRVVLSLVAEPDDLEHHVPQVERDGRRVGVDA